MTTHIIQNSAISECDGIAGKTIQGNCTYGANGLATWMLQRLPHQRGCWYVSLYTRGLSLSAHAVQDDYGDLQLVSA